MADESTSAMIALLPMASDWCQIELPHMTLVYAGQITDLDPSAYNEMAKDASMLSMLSRTITARVLGSEIFGGRGNDEPVNVLKLHATSQILAMRQAVERWDKSEYPFTPHVTVGPAGNPIQNIPSYVAFDRIMVGWGTEQMTFWLN